MGGARRPTGSALDGGDNLVVAGATAEITAQCHLNLLTVGMRKLLEELGSAHHKAGRAVTALHSILVDEGLLHRVQRPLVTPKRAVT